MRKILFGIAVFMVAVRALLQTFGGEEATSILAGSAASELELLFGGTYVFVHLVTVVFVPILVLGTGIDRLLEKKARAS